MRPRLGASLAVLPRGAPIPQDRLIALLTRVLEGSLDVHDGEVVAAHGLAGAAAQQADDLFGADPPERHRFATPR